MLRIRLIGRPSLERDGSPIPGPRGRKSWAVLGRLARASGGVPRSVLVDELFGDADDPAGALRWSLAELRRRTGLTDAFQGDPVSFTPGPDTTVDVLDVAAAVNDGAVPEGVFLDGVDVGGRFGSWLLVERQRVAGEVMQALRQATLAALSAREPHQAMVTAGAMVRQDPLDESGHVLLVKAVAASGDVDAALHQAEASEAMLAEELGTPASPAIRAAARPSVAAPMPGVSVHTTASSLCEAGLAALSAGAADAGIECLRGAAAAAESSGDDELLGRCLTELGTALVHAIRGYDDEGAVILGAAVEAATAAGAKGLAAKALSELAYVDVLAGRRASATEYLRAASELSDDDPSLAATLTSFDAMNLNDWGRLEESADRFAEAVELSRRAGAVRREVWSLGLGARTQFLLGRWDEAVEWSSRSVDLADRERWTAFRPWPEGWLAHVRLARGDDPRQVRDSAERVFAFARQLQDPCWEGLAAKAIGLTYQATHEEEVAAEWMSNARSFCSRVTDSYLWIEVDVLLAEARACLASGDPDRAASVARRARDLAAKSSMDALLDEAADLLDSIG